MRSEAAVGSRSSVFCDGKCDQSGEHAISFKVVAGGSVRVIVVTGECPYAIVRRIDYRNGEGSANLGILGGGSTVGEKRIGKHIRHDPRTPMLHRSATALSSDDDIA